jgi:membrane protein involved in colicin uptake
VVSNVKFVELSPEGQGEYYGSILEQKKSILKDLEEKKLETEKELEELQKKRESVDNHKKRKLEREEQIAKAKRNFSGQNNGSERVINVFEGFQKLWENIESHPSQYALSDHMRLG